MTLLWSPPQDLGVATLTALAKGLVPQFGCLLFSVPGKWVARLTARPSSLPSPGGRPVMVETGAGGGWNSPCSLSAVFRPSHLPSGICKESGCKLPGFPRTKGFSKDVGLPVLYLGQCGATWTIVTQGSLPCLRGFQWLRSLCLPGFKYQVSPDPQVSNGLMVECL